MEPLEVKEESLLVNGIHIKDIPTAYPVTGFKPQESIVIGTYVDKNIIPGFKFKVRKNLSEDYLFNGKALTLESVGLGYGKRLTFKDDNLNDNKNFFWSDSHAPGYGLTFQTLSPNSIFRIKDTIHNLDMGRVTVNDPARSVDTAVSMDVKDGGRIQKTLKIHFSGDTILSSRGNKHIFHEDMELRGTAVVCRDGHAAKAKIEKIVLEDFEVDNCMLVPEE